MSDPNEHTEDGETERDGALPHPDDVMTHGAAFSTDMMQRVDSWLAARALLQTSTIEWAEGVTPFDVIQTAKYLTGEK